MGGSLYCGVLGNGAMQGRPPETARDPRAEKTRHNQEAEHVLPWILELRARMAGDRGTVERDRAGDGAKSGAQLRRSPKMMRKFTMWPLVTTPGVGQLFWFYFSLW